MLLGGSPRLQPSVPMSRVCVFDESRSRSRCGSARQLGPALRCYLRASRVDQHDRRRQHALILWPDSTRGVRGVDVSRDGLPTGVVTFLMSDVEGSAEHWASDPDRMTIAVRYLDSVIADVADTHNGAVLKSRGEGDSHFVVFERPSAAVAAACELQELRNARRPAEVDLRVRVGIHAGEASPSADDYYGIAVNQAARLRGVAHGGQTVVSSVVAALARGLLSGRVHLKSLGHHRVRDFPKLEEIFQATMLGVDDVFAPLRTGESGAPAMMAVAVVDVVDSR